MKKSIFWILAVVAIIVIWGISAYNKIVKSEEAVEAQWGQVENVYQRRADLIPNLVNTVKGYAAHEQETFTAVIEARSKATSVTIDPTNITESNLTQFEAAQSELSNALSKLMVVVERYPELKANENFLQLQAQLEGTENRIAVERKRFNETAQEFNTLIRVFPKNILASMFGFEKKAYFKAAEGADTAPTVEF
ncbi:MAG: LemA family protein [Bacteroidales bacterium]|nr:LemA family protein [Bacteroidales bacterium]